MSIGSALLGMHVLNNNHLPAAVGHAGVSLTDMIVLAAQGGSSVIRVPTDLSAIGPAGVPNWQLDFYGEILSVATQYGVKVIFEPGQTPLDLLPPGGTVRDEPATYQAMYGLADRFATLVEAIHTTFPQYSSTIEGWEVGNEPNLSYQYFNDNTYFGANGDPAAPRFWVVSQNNAQYYAEYLIAVSNRIGVIEQSLGYNVKIIAAGIAHNDAAYMERFFQTLDNAGAQIDAFAVHPYTFYSWPDPQSGRATDWVPTPNGVRANDWNYYHSFQGALYSIQGLANQYGFGDSELHVTEFGVPSFLGYRGAGPAGRLDQAYWVAEALGVFDAWGNDNLKTISAHMVLDTQTANVNDLFNAYDSTPSTPDGSAIADSEGAFAFYERLYAGGPIVEKPVVGLFRAISEGQDYANTNLRIISRVSTDTVDVSSWGTNGVGIVGGYVVLTHGGNDTINGSAFDDSLFAGDGDDTVYGNAGNDRIYGGRGNDTLLGGDGNDDIYGNHGDDMINAGANTNRVDGGTGLDTLVVAGSPGDFTLTGDGRAFTITASWQSTSAINVEQVFFTATGTTLVLANGDITKGNGGLIGGPTPTVIEGTSGNDVLTGTNGRDIIRGLGGNDQIFGLDEDDTIEGGTGDDVIWGGYGTNNINGGDGFDTVIIDGPQANYTISVNGQTVQVGGPGVWTLITNAEQLVFDDGVNPSTSVDLVELLGGHNVINGTAGDDYLTGTIGKDHFKGLAGEDVFRGGEGDDIYDGGGSEYDQVDFEGYAADYTFTENGDGSITATNATYGTDTLISIEGAWFLGEGAWYSMDSLVNLGAPIVGTSGDDYLVGTAGNDTILGGEGNDTLYGGEGDDLLDGQGGAYNQVDYDGAASDYTFARQSDGSVTVSHPVYGTDTLKEIDGVWFFGESAWYSLDDLAPDPNGYVGTGHGTYYAGSATDDTIIFTGGTGNYTEGGAGNDTVVFGGSVADYEILGQGDHFTVYNTVTGDQIQFKEIEYISFSDATSISLDDIVGNSGYNPGDTWFDPEPIGGLI